MNDAPVVAIIDDDVFVRSAMTEFLRSAGVASRSFGSATAFLAEADPRAFSCIVSDLDMPGLSGLALHERLRGDGDAPPFILITGFPSATVRATALAGGAREVFEKPLDGGALLALLQEILR